METLTVFRAGRGHGRADILCAGGPQHMVRAGICRSLRAGFGLRLPAGRLAVRRGRGDMGLGGAEALAGALTTDFRPLLPEAKDHSHYRVEIESGL